MKKTLLVMSLLSLLTACGAKEKKEASPMTPPSGGTSAPAAKSEAKATETAATKAGSITCSLNKDQRTIEVRQSGDGCEVIYKKLDSEETVASAVNGMDHCGKVQERIKGNLTTAGFTCQ